MRRCEDEKMFYRPPLLEEPCAQTLSGKRCRWLKVIKTNKNIGKTGKNLGKPKKTLEKTKKAKRTIFRESWLGPPLSKESRNIAFFPRFFFCGFPRFL